MTEILESLQQFYKNSWYLASKNMVIYYLES